MGKPRNVGREIALSLLAALVLGGGLAMYIARSIDAGRPRPSVLVESRGAQRSGDETRTSLDAARDLVARFAAALSERRYADAYRLMAPAYRQAFDQAAFEAACTTSPFLSTLTSATVVSTRHTIAPGSVARAYTLQGRGVLITRGANLDAGYVFLVNEDRLYLLVLSIAGVPVLDGIRGALP